VQLNFITQRGVISAQRSIRPWRRTICSERPLTEAARAIVRSGDGPLIDAIRKVSPRMFGDFARTFAAATQRTFAGQTAAAGRNRNLYSPQLMRLKRQRNRSQRPRNSRHAQR